MFRDATAVVLLVGMVVMAIAAIVVMMAVTVAAIAVRRPGHIV